MESTEKMPINRHAMMLKERQNVHVFAEMQHAQLCAVVATVPTFLVLVVRHLTVNQPLRSLAIEKPCLLIKGKGDKSLWKVKVPQ